MDRHFREVAGFYKQIVVLTHRQRVTRMYRKSLRTLDSWACDRGIWNEEAGKLRAQFDAHKHLPADSG
jgi:hypothetical protein